MTNVEFEASIKLIQADDKSGLEKIYKEYITVIYSVVLSIVKNKENAEDITSDFFIKLWDKSKLYDFSYKHKSWLITIAHNMSIDFLRKNKSEVLTSEFFEEGCLNENSFENNIHHKIIFEDALNNLKDAERQVINMRILGDLTFKEISRILNKPLGTITWQYQNAINKLRRYEYEEIK
ncbi:MAG: sigma-70 family RNA polymerase sigma factor [Clostridium sp.]|uniref:RNA polymerase sigma factor n=1 Tax=Clostridium sp. TaxID=1506 RepID=UPI00303F37F3